MAQTNVQAFTGDVEIAGSLTIVGGVDKVTLASDSTNTNRPVIFTTGTANAQPLKTDGGLVYNPSTNKLTVSGGLSQSLSAGSYLTGSAYNGATARTFNVDATTTATASKVVARDTAADIFARLFRSNYANQTDISGGMAFRINNSTDSYIRFCSDIPAIRTFLNVPTRTGGNASGTWAISISGNAGSSTNVRVDRYDSGDTTMYLTMVSDATAANSKRLYMDANLIYDNTDNRLRLNRVMFGNQNTYGLGGVAGDYGSVGTVGTGKGSWEGYSINGQWVFMSQSAGTCGIYNDTNNNWATIWNQNGSTDLYYNGGNKVQTTSDGAHVSGNLYADRAYIDDYIYHNGDTNTYYGFDAADHFRIVAAGGTRFQVDSNGHIGIGTTVPGQLLDVNGNIKLSGSGRQIYLDTGGAGLYWGDGYSRIVDDGDLRICTDDNLRFNTGSSSSSLGTERMIINSTGVGIGTSGPAQLLDVAGRIRADSMEIDDYIYHVGDTNSRFGFSNNDSFWVVTNNAGRFFIDSGGRVGIATTAPQVPLHIATSGGEMSNNTRTYFSSSSGGLFNNVGNFTNISLYASGVIVGGSWIVSHSGSVSASDSRIKKHITDIDDGAALETLRLLKPKQYKYKDVIGRGETPVWGFIAQEVSNVLPYSTAIRTDFIPNIYELANVSQSNVITFSNHTTTSFNTDTSKIRLMGINGKELEVRIVEIIDDHTIRVDEDLDEYTGYVSEDGELVYSGASYNTLTSEEYEALEDKTGYSLEGDVYVRTIIRSNIFVYGEQVDDFHFLKKDSIFTVATAALQELDRQLQAEKARNDALETKVENLESLVASLVTRIDNLE